MNKPRSNDEVTTLIRHEAARVRVMKLAALTASPAHYHTHVHEYIVCLEGRLSVFTGDGAAEAVLSPGDHASIRKQIVHWLRNESDTESKYLLTQSGGEYDFIETAQ